MSSLVMHLTSLTSGFWCRYVRTQGFTDEQAAGKILYAGAFATGNPSGQLLNNPFKFVVKNVANTGASSHVTTCLHGRDVGWIPAAHCARGCGQLPMMMRGQLHGTAGNVWVRSIGLSTVHRRVGVGGETVRAARERAAPRDAAGGPVYCRRDRSRWQHRGQGALCGALPHHAPARRQSEVGIGVRALRSQGRYSVLTFACWCLEPKLCTVARRSVATKLEP